MFDLLLHSRRNLLIVVAVLVCVGLVLTTFEFFARDSVPVQDDTAVSPIQTKPVSSKVSDSTENAHVAPQVMMALEVGGDVSKTVRVDSRDDLESIESEELISLDVENHIVSVDVNSASFDEVVGRLAERLGFKVVDLRPEETLDGGDAEPGLLSFSYSGTVSETLRFVIDRYGYSHAVSYYPSNAVSAKASVEKLFIYGPSLNDPIERVGREEGASSQAQSGSRTALDARNNDNAERKPNLAEVLRNRALHSSLALTKKSNSQHRGLDPQAGLSERTLNNSGVASVSEDERLRAQLTEMTQRAREEVEALAEGLKAAEKNLNAPRAGQGATP